MRHHHATQPIAGTAPESKLELRESGGRANFIALSLPDLLLDDTGSIVIETGGDMLVIELSGYQDVVKRGIAPDGTLSQHFNVSGMDYCQFLDGTRLYYAADEVRLLLAPE